jgi:undecaprenyl-diphosphatase
MPVALALFIGGVLFVLIERWLKGQPGSTVITWPVVVAVGVGQLIAAVFPGTSRSGATILLALALGLSRPIATEFSFLVGIPTMLAAGGLKIFKALHHAGPGPVEDWGQVLVATVISAIVSFIVVRWLLRFVQTHTFTGFGWYRIAFGALVLIVGLAMPPKAHPAPKTSSSPAPRAAVEVILPQQAILGLLNFAAN